MHLKKMCSWDPTDTEGPKTAIGKSSLLKSIAFTSTLVTLTLAVSVAILIILLYRPSAVNYLKGVK